WVYAISSNLNSLGLSIAFKPHLASSTGILGEPQFSSIRLDRPILVSLYQQTFLAPMLRNQCRTKTISIKSTYNEVHHEAPLSR
ncbi:MAG: hypothetical protein NT070_06845, partial [Cyanobacteria bacterium]|nr:hypothetical protein [Cyanobacteriota bacterium]